MSPLVTALQQIEILSGLEIPLLEQLASFSQIRQMRKGETIFLQGEPSPYCFGLLEGEVTIHRNDRDRRYPPKIIGLVGSGALFGESALFEDHPRSASATATADGQLILIQGIPLRQWISLNHLVSVPLLMAILKNSLEHLQRTTRELSVVYGIDRLLEVQGDFIERMQEVANFLRCSVEGVDRVVLFRANPYWEEYEPLVSIPDLDPIPTLTAGSVLLAFARNTLKTTLLTGPDLLKVLPPFGASWAEMKALALVPLLNRDGPEPVLEGILLAATEKENAFVPAVTLLLNAVTHQLAEAFLRYRREQDNAATHRLQKTRESFPL